MPTTLVEIPGVVEDSPRKRWTRAEYEEFAESTVLAGQKLELVEGDLIDKMGKKRPHSNPLEKLNRWLLGVFGDFVNREVPIDVAPEDNPTSEPEPDLIVLNREYTEFESQNPGPDDLRLVIEISDSRLSYDLRTKADLYARAGIVEYWVLDVIGRRMIVHRDPGNGRYQSVVAYGEDEKISCLAAPQAELRVGDTFPAPKEKGSK